MAWDLTSKEHTETGQRIIKKLATEEGLAMIKALTDEQADGVEPETRLRNFKDRTLPFFRTISHPDILFGDTTQYYLHISFWPQWSSCYQPIQVYDFRSWYPLLGTKAKDEELTSMYVAVVANLKVERCVSGGWRMIPMTHGSIRLVIVAAPRLCRRQGFVACQSPHLLLIYPLHIILLRISGNKDMCLSSSYSQSLYFHHEWSQILRDISGNIC